MISDLIPLLSILALLPLLGALVLTCVRGAAARVVGLCFAFATTALGVFVFVLGLGTHLSETLPWTRVIRAFYVLELDFMSAVMVLLAVILTPLVLIAEWHVGDAEDARWLTRTFFALVLALERLSLLVFLASDVLLLYVMFETMLAPMYFMVSGFGGPERATVAVKFLLFSLAGGPVTLVGVAGSYAVSAGAGELSFLIRDLMAPDLGGDIGHWLFAAFFFAFAVKVSMAGLHTWLPDTAEQATAGSSTMLMGILDKIGTFGMIKICLTIFPKAPHWATPVILVWAMVSMFYGALMALGGPDLLRFASCTSVSHFGFTVLGVFALTTQSLSGSIFYMLNHGFSTAAIFLVVGFLVKRRGTAVIEAYDGVQKTAPVLAGFLLLSGLSVLALPGMSSFVSGFLVMAGSWQRYPVHTATLTLGMVLVAAYVLTVYKRTMTGLVPDDVRKHVSTNPNLRERLAVAPLLVLLIFFGFPPRPLLQVADDVVRNVMQTVGEADPTPTIQGEN